MSAPDARLFINQSERDPSRALVTSFSSSVPASAPFLVRGSQPTYELHFLRVNPAGDLARPFVYDDPATWDGVTLQAGAIDAPPDAGTFTLTDPAAGQTTAAIAIASSAATLQTAIRAALTTNYGAATVTGAFLSWEIDRGVTGAIVALTADAGSLAPAGSTVLIEGTQTGSATLHARTELTLLQAAAASRTGVSGDGWNALPAVLVTPSIQTAGSGTVNKTFRVLWNADAYSGSVFLSFTGDTATEVIGPISFNASIADVVAAFVAHTDVEPVGVAVIKNGAGDYSITCIGAGILHSDTPALATSSNTLRVPVGLSGVLNLSTAGVTRLLGTALAVKTTIEVEKIIDGVPSTPLQLSNATLIKDLIRHSGSSEEITSPRVKEYVVFLTQIGIDAPVATPLRNTLGGSLVWTYVDVGEYHGTLAGAFPAGKVFWTISLGSTTPGFVALTRFSDNEVRLYTEDVSGTSFDDLLSNTAVNISVYP